MTEKIYTDATIGDVLVRKSPRARRVSIRIHPVKGVTVTIPRWTPFSAGLAFLAAKRDWVKAVLARQSALVGRAADEVQQALSEHGLADGTEPGAAHGHMNGRGPEDPKGLLGGTERSGGFAADSFAQRSINRLIELWRAEAKKVLPPRLEELAGKYGFTYNRLTIKHNISNWGSCSRRGNINLNLNLVRVPQPLRDYVMLHELSHLRFPNHGAGFHALLEEMCLEELGIPARSLEKELKKYLLL